MAGSQAPPDRLNAPCQALGTTAQTKPSADTKTRMKFFSEARFPSAAAPEASAVPEGVSRFGSLENRMFSTAAPMDGFTAVPKRDTPSGTARCQSKLLLHSHPLKITRRNRSYPSTAPPQKWHAACRRHLPQSHQNRNAARRNAPSHGSPRGQAGHPNHRGCIPSNKHPLERTHYGPKPKLAKLSLAREN